MRGNHVLELYTEFELITAAQLCLERNRDEPTERDFADAVEMCSKWNQQRIKAGLRPWS